MGDVDSECTSPRTMDRRARRAAALAKFQSDAAAAAKLNSRRHQYSTNVSYIPASANAISSHVQMLVKAAEARAKQLEFQSTAAAAAGEAAATIATIDAELDDVLPKDVSSIILAMQSLRIQLIIDPCLSVQELTALCEETSRNEALASANPAKSVEFVRLQQLRNDLEAEVYRCILKKAIPTPHVHIASSDHRGHSRFLGNILTSAIMCRTFVSMTAFTAAVNADIGQFLTSPSRGNDRIAVVRSTS